MPTCLRFLLALCFLASLGCDAKNPNKLDVKSWVKEHKPKVESLRAQLSAASQMANGLAAENVHNTAASPPPKPITDQWGDGENTLLIKATSLIGMSEYGEDDDKSIDNGEMSISIAYTGHVDLRSAFAMVDEGKPGYLSRKGEAVGLAKKIAKLKYLVVGRTVSYQPGTVVGQQFSPGSFQGVAHIMELEGPKHLGSVTYAATNTKAFESYEGSAQYMLRADLEHATARAFHAALATHFPEIVMPSPPAIKEVAP